MNRALIRPAGSAAAFRWALFIFATLPALAPAESPVVRFRPTTKTQPAAVEVTGLDTATLSQWRDKPPTDWSETLAVFVGDSRTPIIGSYSVDKTALRFEPRFPFTPGLKYRCVFTPSSGPKVESDFTVPKASPAISTTVEHVFPSCDTLPENQLKFYIHFTAAMTRGEAYSRIHLRDEKGKDVEHPFLELEEELWDPAGRRFTLFIHPGRIKRGLKPREELGPVLVEGKRYTLVVDAAWQDGDGNPLGQAFRKEFRVGPPDEAQPDPKTWKILAPPSGSKETLLVRLSKPLDHALLHRLLWIVDASGQRVGGRIQVGERETVWGFAPEQPWKAMKYRLVIDTALEDLAGNSIARPFEVDEFRAVQKEVKVQTVDLPFIVR
jgi:hypothetical protein